MGEGGKDKEGGGARNIGRKGLFREKKGESN